MFVTNHSLRKFDYFDLCCTRVYVHIWKIENINNRADTSAAAAAATQLVPCAFHIYILFISKYTLARAHTHNHQFENHQSTRLDSTQLNLIGSYPIFVQFMTFMSVGDMEWQTTEKSHTHTYTHYIHSVCLWKIYTQKRSLNGILWE